MPGIDGVVSYGPCQFPTLGFVVERWRRRQAHVATPFWYLDVIYRHDDATAKFSWSRVRTFDMETCQALYDVCCEQPIMTIVEIQSKEKRKWYRHVHIHLHVWISTYNMCMCMCM